MSEQPQHIFLVHGTILVPWLMASPAWIAPGHPFHEQLADTFPDAEIVPFRWRGGNLHHDRLHAAHELAAQIDEREGTVLVIGHSHGGNVARMALQLAADRPATTRLITLATPFLNVRWHAPDHLGRRRAWVSWQTWWSFTWSAALSLLIITSLVAGLQGVNPLGPSVDTMAGESPEVSLWQASALTLAASLATITLLLALPLAAFFGVLHGVGSVLIRRVSRELGGECADGDWLACVDTRPRRGALRRTSAEAVAVENDEAAWSLNLGQAAGSVGAVLGSTADTRRNHGRTRLLLNVLVTAAVALTWLRGEGWELKFPALQILSFVQSGDGWGDELLLVIGLFLLATGAGGLVGMSIQIFEYLSAGWDSLVIADRARVSVSTAPPGSSSMTLLDVSGVRRHRGLRHSVVYEDQDSVDAILAVARRTTPAAPPGPVAA